MPAPCLFEKLTGQARLPDPGGPAMTHERAAPKTHRLDGALLRADLQTGFVGQAGPKVVELSEGFDPTP